MVRRSSRAAFTVLELLVVLAIVATLLALLIPAVQRLREAGDRSYCQNNLKQLGVALHAYHDQYGKFPQAYNEWCNLCEPTDQPGAPDFRPRKSWATLILPFVEQEVLAGLPTQQFRSAVIATFLCPTDQPNGQETSDGGSFQFLGNRFGLTSYLAVEGSAYQIGPGQSLVNLQFDGPKDGVIFRSGDIRLTDIRDGSSSTLLLGERPPSPPPDLDWGWWTWSAYDTALAVVDWRMLPYGNECGAPARYGPGNSDDPCSAHHFWSCHDGGANWLFADGSVHFLTYAAADILPALATRSGGEAVEPFP